MMLNSKQDYICLVWKDTKTRRRFQVGKLAKNTEYHFSYGLEVDEAIKYGFKPLVAFSDFKQTYKHQTLFPSFASRLPDKKRKDINKILKKYEVDAYDEYELLKKSGARLPIDSLEFIEPILHEEKNITRNFYIAGTRYYLSCDGDICDKATDVNVDDQLVLEPEPTNEHDPNAIKVLKKNGEHLGYIPRYYSEELTKHLKNGASYKLLVKSVWKNNNCDECIMVNLSID